MNLVYLKILSVCVCVLYHTAVTFKAFEVTILYWESEHELQSHKN